MGIVTANQVANGLGFNIDSNGVPAGSDDDWEFAAAAAAGATHVRFQCSWENVERQSPAPDNVPSTPQYAEDPNCVAGFKLAKKYGMHPTIVAAYSPPHHALLTVAAQGGAAIGATSIDLTLVSGVGGATFDNVRFPYDYISASPYGLLSNTGAYYGTLITGITVHSATKATINLASALKQNLPADNTEYLINELLYPSAATNLPNDPSVVAYGNYVNFLARDMAEAGLTGEVEIWNEPPGPDYWDNRYGLYDPILAPPFPISSGPYNSGDPNYGFVANLQTKSLPPGITLTWNGTSGNGYASPDNIALFKQETGVRPIQPATVVTTQSFHPYGGGTANPEQFSVPSDCLTASAAAYPAYPSGYWSVECILPGEPTTPNMSGGLWFSQIQRDTANDAAYGINSEITETNILPRLPGYRLQQARFVMRQFLAFQATGITPVEFYKLYDASTPSEPNFSFIEENGTSTTYTPNQSYTAISGFMADVRGISAFPVASYSGAMLPSVASYSGTYPLSTAHFVGARAGATSNSDVMTLVQRSYCADPSETNGYCWLEQTSPAPASVMVNIPSGMMVTSIVNMTTRETVSYTAVGQQIQLAVADDPVEILLDPKPATIATTLTPGGNPATSGYGQQVVLSAALEPYSSSRQTTNGENVAFYEGSTLLGVGALSSGVATLDVTSLPVGSSQISVSYGGDTYFAPSTAFFTYSVAASTPTLVFNSVGNRSYGAPPFQVSATSNSPAPIVYAVVSGPATISGNTVTLSEAGTVVLCASQAATGNYTAASAQTTFVAAFTPVITLATTTGATVFSTGSNVTLQAFIPSSGTLAAPSGTLSFNIVGTTATYTGTPFTYSATVGGFVSVITLSSVSGVHTYTASIAADTNYNAATSNVLTINVTTNDVWVANSDNTIFGLTESGTAVTSSAQHAGGTGVAIDNAGNVWSAYTGKNMVSKYSNTGLTLGSYSVGGTTAPTALAIDGSGLVWVTNGNGSISAITPAGTAASPSVGYGVSASTPTSINIDSAGNVWITNSGDNSISEVIGAATPVATPLTLAVTNNNLAARP